MIAMNSHGEKHIAQHPSPASKGNWFEERGNAAFLEFGGASVVASELGVNFRLSFLLGALAAAAIEIAREKLN